MHCCSDSSSEVCVKWFCLWCEVSLLNLRLNEEVLWFEEQAKALWLQPFMNSHASTQVASCPPSRFLSIWRDAVCSFQIWNVGLINIHLIGGTCAQSLSRLQFQALLCASSSVTLNWLVSHPSAPFDSDNKRSRAFLYFMAEFRFSKKKSYNIHSHVFVSWDKVTILSASVLFC